MLLWRSLCLMWLPFMGPFQGKMILSLTNSLRTGSLRERKKIRRAKCESGSEASGSRSVNPRAKRVGCGAACRHCCLCVLPPLWRLACYKSVKKVIKPVKIDVFFSALMRRLFLITFYRTRVSMKRKSNGSVFAVSAKSC